MITEQLIARINELARKAKTTGLTEEETAERNELRSRYLQGFRASFRAQLENIEVVDAEDPNKQTDTDK